MKNWGNSSHRCHQMWCSFTVDYVHRRTFDALNEKTRTSGCYILKRQRLLILSPQYGVQCYIREQLDCSMSRTHDVVWPVAWCKLTSVMIQSSVYMALSISLQSWTTLTPCWRGSSTKSLNGFHCHIYHPPVYQLMVSVWQGQIPHSRVLTVYSVTDNYVFSKWLLIPS